MGLFTSGVSNGTAVGPTPTSPTTAPVSGGITLALAGDYAQLFLSGAANPGGPDTGGLILLSGTYTGGSVNVQYVPDLANWTLGNWQPLNNVVRRDTGGSVTGAFALTNNSAVQIDPGNVQGLYAIRVLLPTALTTGSLNVSGFTNPGSVAGSNQLILTQLAAQNTLLKGVLLALQDIGGSSSYNPDYLGAVGSSL